MLKLLSKFIFYPLWDLKDRSLKLKTLRELKVNQWLREEDLKKRQWKKLKHILNYAYTNCEYYKLLFDRHNIKLSEINIATDLSKIPILKKIDIRENVDLLVSRNIKKSNLIMAKTGGSTGTALKLFFDKKCEEMRNAAALRSDKWANWDMGDKKAAIWGNPPIAKTFKEKLRNRLIDRTIYLDTMKLNDTSMKNFVRLYRKYKPAIIYGHSHSIYVLAKFLQDNKIFGSIRISQHEFNE